MSDFQSWSTTAAQQTPTPAPSSGAKGRSNMSSGSNLYLFTFLATLCLLLFVSFSIVARSFVLRRRFHRQINEAIAAGRLISPRAQGSRKRQLAEKPKFYDAWVTPGNVGDSWDSIMPVSAHVLSKAHSRRSSYLHASRTLDNSARPVSHERRLSRRPSLFSILSRSSERKHGATPSTEGDTPDDNVRVEKVQVSVLVAMPTPRTAPSTTDVSTINSVKLLEQDEMPNVVLGVTQTSYTTKNPR